MTKRLKCLLIWKESLRGWNDETLEEYLQLFSETPFYRLLYLEFMRRLDNIKDWTLEDEKTITYVPKFPANEITVDLVLKEEKS